MLNVFTLIVVVSRTHVQEHASSCHVPGTEEVRGHGITDNNGVVSMVIGVFLRLQCVIWSNSAKSAVCIYCLFNAWMLQAIVISE